jgi:hypothetical protein
MRLIRARHFGGKNPTFRGCREGTDGPQPEATRSASLLNSYRADRQGVTGGYDLATAAAAQLATVATDLPLTRKFANEEWNPDSYAPGLRQHVAAARTELELAGRQLIR